MPLLAAVTLASGWGRPLGLARGLLLSAALFAAVVAAIHHAEVVAHRVGEPFGTLVLAVAVTVIEVALIVALMLAGGEGANSLARDTVFAAVMIACNGIVGLCLVVGGLRHGVLAYRVEGTSPALASLAALAGLALVLPSFTTSTPGPTYSGSQLAFAGITFALVLGLPPMQIVLLTLTLLIAALTLGSGHATVMQGAVHLVLFAAFLFLTVVP